MDERNEIGSEPSGAVAAQVIVLSSAAALVAAVIGLAAYAYLKRRSEASPEGLLRHCRTAIDQIERSLDLAHA